VQTYTVTAINVGSFNLGEADRVLTIFCPEKGILKAVAKGARKPGSKMSGRSDILCLNELLLSPGRTFEIITQAQSVESFSFLRNNLVTLSYGLYFAELTACFGQGLADNAGEYFDFLRGALTALGAPEACPLSACMEFEAGLLDFLGYKPELTFCIACRQALDEYKLSRFNIELGGVVCQKCSQKGRRLAVRDTGGDDFDADLRELNQGVHLTPLVWKSLVLRSAGSSAPASFAGNRQVQEAAQRILQAYIEHRAGKKFKTLQTLSQLEESPANSAK
jgi:DNA repair protein RecO (recombination protein O)